MTQEIPGARLKVLTIIQIAFLICSICSCTSKTALVGTKWKLDSASRDELKQLVLDGYYLTFVDKGLIEAENAKDSFSFEYKAASDGSIRIYNYKSNGHSAFTSTDERKRQSFFMMALSNAYRYEFSQDTSQLKIIGKDYSLTFGRKEKGSPPSSKS
jgi:hypothetical protein